MGQEALSRPLSRASPPGLLQPLGCSLNLPCKAHALICQAAWGPCPGARGPGGVFLCLQCSPHKASVMCREHPKPCLLHTVKEGRFLQNKGRGLDFGERTRKHKSGMEVSSPELLLKSQERGGSGAEFESRPCKACLSRALVFFLL